MTLTVISLPAFQNYVKDKVLAGISQKIGKPVIIDTLNISLSGNIELKGLLLYDDKDDTLIHASNLKVNINTSALFKKEIDLLSISIEEGIFNLEIRDTAGHSNLDIITNAFSDSTKKEKKTENNKPGWKINIRKVEIKKSGFTFRNTYDSLYMAHRVKDFDLTFKLGDISNLRFITKRVELNGYKGELISYKKSAKTEFEKTDSSDKKSNVTVAVPEIEVQDVSFSNFDSANGAGGNYYLESGKLVPKRFDLKNQQIIIDSIFLKHGRVLVKGPSVNSPGPINSENKNNKKPPEKGWDIWLYYSDINLDTVLLKNLITAPKGFEYLSNLTFTDVRTSLEGEFHSTDKWAAKKLNLAFVDQRTWQQTSLQAKIKSENGFIFMDSLNFETGDSKVGGHFRLNTREKDSLTIPDFYMDALLQIKDILSYIPAHYIPTNIRNPEKLIVSGNFYSKNNNLRALTQLKTDFGKIDIDAAFARAEPLNASRYSAEIEISDIYLPSVLKDSTLGALTAHIGFYGTGINPQELDLHLWGKIDTFYVKNNLYKNTTFNGYYNNEDVNLNLYSPNPIANFNLNVSGKIKKNENNLQIKSDIKNLDLMAMGFTKDTISIAAYLSAFYKEKDSNTFEIYADTNYLKLKTAKKELSSSQQWSYYSSMDSVAAEFYSENINFLYKGNVKLENIATCMKDYFLQYYSSKEELTKLDTSKQFELSVSMKDLDKFSEFMPMKMKIPGQNMIHAQLKSNEFSSKINIERATLNEFNLDTIGLNISSDSAHLNLDLNLVVNSATYKRRPLEFNGSLSKGIADARFKVSTFDGTPWFEMGMNALLDFPIFKAKLIEPLIISHVQWDLDTGNIFYVVDHKTQDLNILMENGPKKIYLYLNPRNRNVYNAEFRALSLNSLSEVIWGDTGTLSGDLYAFLSYDPTKTIEDFPVFSAEVSLDGLAYKNFPLGNIRLKAVNQRNPNVADIYFRQQLNESFLLINGNIGLVDKNPMKLQITSKEFNISKLKPFLAGILEEPEGNVESQINIRGTTDDLNVDGKIQLDSMSIGIVATSSEININQQSIYFKGKQIQLNNFTIKDGFGNPLSINGTFKYNDFKDFNYQANISSKKFLAYSSPPDQLASKQSKVIVTSDIQVNGKGVSPIVKASIQIDEGSKFFYELSNKYNNYSEIGVVIFTDSQSFIPNAPVSVFKNMNLTANISLAAGTGIRILTDPAKGDGFNLQAGGAFTFSQQPFQMPRITGKVDISKGLYTMNLTGLKRNFEIAPGSTITWNGDITNIDFKLRAYYTVKASPLPILSVANSSQFASLLPFNVNLNLEGSMSTPEMQFDISLPEEYRDIYNGLVTSRLQQINSDEALVNKQAMSLLLFGTFFDLTDISNSLFSGGKGTTNALISNALNQFAAQEIKFVNLHFDLQSYDYYGGGENYQDARTELKIEASKKFLDNRLNTQAGADLLLQGDPREEADLNINRLTPSFKIDYLVNKRRTVTVKLFQQNEYKGLLEGKVISVGAGLQYSNDYNHARDLLKRKTDNNTYVQ